MEPKLKLIQGGKREERPLEGPSFARADADSSVFVFESVTETLREISRVLMRARQVVPEHRCFELAAAVDYFRTVPLEFVNIDAILICSLCLLERYTAEKRAAGNGTP